MASVNKDAKGWRVLYVHPDGRRKTLRLSGLNKAKVQAIGRHVDELCQAKASGQPIDRQTSLWLNDIGQTLHDKLSRAGLVEARQSSSLADFTAEYVADAKTIDGNPAAANTLKKWRSAEKVLIQYFGNRNLRDISHDDAVRFRRWLDETHLNENAKRTHISVVKMLFNAAKRRKLVEENPFEFQKASLVIDRSRDFYLSREHAQKIIDVCPDNQWRLIVALWRFAGLRKMEIFHLRWDQVLWDQGRMLVTCQKTAHHEGKGSRFVPI
ncbi:MAG: site-specific integrase, partial [Planctomycetaceae bacterium]|nr:site-specific integrase [Planctomycetaceae bacterium]